MIFVSAAAAPKRPNVLLLVAGGEIPGPGILRFSRAYAACPSSAPGRAAILGGRFPHAAPCGEPSLQSELKRAGYSAACMGEWGCGPAAGDRAAAIGFLRAGIPSSFCLCLALDSDAAPVLEALDRTGLAGDTIVVLTSLRGPAAGGPRDESARVPLALRYPRRIPGGRVLEFLVSGVDLAPTLLGLCGLETPRAMQGRDLSDLLLNGQGDPPESIYAEGGLHTEGEWRMVVRGLDKLVVSAQLQPTHLFNLGQDPEELVNLVSEPFERRKRDEMLALLRRWMLRTGDRLPRRLGVR
ncbi:MAG: sulfatase-like hydrolase/transferase [Acidobacteria bacterium]|nr:sulfatase-like hydrolase/transferase [Acidobacteriota bacterium]